MSQEEVNKIIDFILKYSPYTDREQIGNFILTHIRYGTFDYCLDKSGEVIFVCRWNIHKTTARVFDLIIAPKYRKLRTIKWIMARNLPRFPYVRFLEWERGKKYPHKGFKLYSVDELIRRK